LVIGSPVRLGRGRGPGRGSSSRWRPAGGGRRPVRWGRVRFRRSTVRRSAMRRGGRCSGYRRSGGGGGRGTRGRRGSCPPRGVGGVSAGAGDDCFGGGFLGGFGPGFSGGAFSDAAGVGGPELIEGVGLARARACRRAKLGCV